MQKIKLQETSIHILVACIFLLAPFLFSPGEINLSRALQDPHIKRDLLSSVCMLFFFYGNYFYFIPKLYFNKKYIAFALIALIFLLVIAILPPLFFPFEMRNAFGPPGRPKHNQLDFLIFEIGHQFFLFAATLLLSLTVRINRRWRKTEREKLNAELSYLKAQINPHFLFNTLNSIYSLSILKSEKTPEAIVKLSNMMRYVLSDAHQNRVPLEKEINYIENYIELQKLRLGNTVGLHYEVTGKMESKQIAPLILISFVENAFKHGVNAEEDSLIAIKLHVETDSLRLEVKNNIVKSNLEYAEKSGLGIENTKTRLSLLYPNKHELIIQDKGKTFEVALKIYFV